jgi:hypothetical protein
MVFHLNHSSYLTLTQSLHLMLSFSYLVYLPSFSFSILLFPFPLMIFTHQILFTVFISFLFIWTFFTTLPLIYVVTLLAYAFVFYLQYLSSLFAFIDMLITTFIIIIITMMACYLAMNYNFKELVFYLLVTHMLVIVKLMAFNKVILFYL